MPTMSISTEFARLTDAMCDGSAVRSPEDVMVCTIESARSVKHIPLESQTGDGMRLHFRENRGDY